MPIEFAAAPHDATGKPSINLPTAFGRSITVRLDGPGSATFSTFTDDPNAKELIEAAQGREHDIFAYLQPEDGSTGSLVFRGRCGPPQPQLDADKGVVSFVAVDYRGVLGRIPLESAPTFTGVDQHDIVWQLVQAVQALPGGDLGITRGLYSSGTPRDRLDWAAGKTVGQCIDELAAEAGFDWAVNPDLEIDCFSPRRGANTGDTVLSYPAQLITGSSSPGFDSAEWANVVIATGNADTTPAISASPSVATDPRGRWAAVVSSQNVTQQDTLNERAASLRAEIERSAPDWSFTLRPGTWGGPAHMWVGDTVQLGIRSGHIVRDSPARITAITITSADGADTVSMELMTP